MERILHFSNKPPFPLRDGGCVAISSILKSLLLSSHLKVTHYTLSTYKHPFDLSKYPDGWKNKMEIKSRKIETKTNILGALTHLVRNKSYNVSRFYDQKVATDLKQILQKDKFSYVILESIYLLPYLDLFKSYNLKVIVRTHNVEHKIWDQLGINASFIIKKKYYSILAKQLKTFEDTMLTKVDGIIAITEDDAKYFQQFEPKVLTTAIPTSVRTNFPQADYSLSDFYFLGAMDWQPNQEGIRWFLNKVIPNGLKGTKFFVAGKSLNKKDINHPDVENCGEIKNAVDFISSHGICIIPMQSGSGLKIKLLENMAMGKPIVTTTEGIRGVNITPNKEVLVADSPDEFRELMYKLHLDQNFRQQIGTEARQFIHRHYNEEKLTRRLLAFIEDI